MAEPIQIASPEDAAKMNRDRLLYGFAACDEKGRHLPAKDVKGDWQPGIVTDDPRLVVYQPPPTWVTADVQDHEGAFRRVRRDCLGPFGNAKEAPKDL